MFWFDSTNHSKSSFFHLPQLSITPKNIKTVHQVTIHVNPKSMSSPSLYKCNQPKGNLSVTIASWNQLLFICLAKTERCTSVKTQYTQQLSLYVYMENNLISEPKVNVISSFNVAMPRGNGGTMYCLCVWGSLKTGQQMYIHVEIENNFIRDPVVLLSWRRILIQCVENF